MCRYLQVADCRMPMAVKGVLPQTLVLGSMPLVRQLMSDRVFNSPPCTPCGPSTLGPDLGPQLVLALLILTDDQTPPWPDPGCSAPRASWTRATGIGWKLGLPSWGHWHGLAVWTGARPVRAVQGKIVLGAAFATLRPGTGNDVHTLRGPLGHLRTRHGAQVDSQLQQPQSALQDSGRLRHGLRLRLVGRADAAILSDVAGPSQGTVLLEAVAGCSAALAAVAHVRVLPGLIQNGRDEPQAPGAPHVLAAGRMLGTAAVQPLQPALGQAGAFSSGPLADSARGLQQRSKGHQANRPSSLPPGSALEAAAHVVWNAASSTSWCLVCSNTKTFRVLRGRAALCYSSGVNSTGGFPMLSSSKAKDFYAS
jgi:hypothetical protein